MSLLTALPPVDEILLAAVSREKTIPSLKTALYVPENIAANMPLLTVRLLPGSASKTEMSVGLDLDVYTATRGGATGGRAVCAMVESIVTNHPIWAVVGSRRYVVDAISGSTFHEVPWDDDTVRHYLATIQVDTRRV